MKWMLGLFAPVALVAGFMLPAHGADLLVLSEDVPAGLDYDGPAGSLIPSYTGMVNLLESLVYFSRSGMSEEGVQLLDFDEYEGRLAESWSFDEDSLTWTFKLRRGVVGCNGETFDADDVIYTYARAKSISGVAPIGWFLSSVSSIDGFTPAVFGSEDARKLGDEVTKVDDFTVTFRQSGPNPLFLRVLTIFAIYIFDKETMEANATPDDPWSHTYSNNVNAAGFGPWCLSSWEKGSSFTVTANPNYYRGKAAFDRVIVRKVPQSSNRTVVLRSGQAQIVERLTPKEYDSLRGVRGIDVVGTFGNENLFLHLNFKTPPFDNIKVRQAIAHALPYEQIIKTGYFGDARKWAGVIPSSYPGFHRSATQYTRDLDKARALLAEAGFPCGAGLESFADAMKLAYIAEKESALGPIATIMRTALQEIGIPLELDPIPQTQYGDRELVKKDLPLGLTDHVKPIGVDAGYGVLLSFVSPQNGGVLNSMNYSNELVDNTYFATVNESNLLTRNRLLATIQDQLMQDLAVVPIVEFKTNWAYSDKIEGITWHPDNALHWYDFSPAR